MTRLVEQGAGLTLGEETTVNELTKQKDELIKERDAQVEQIVSLRNTVRDCWHLKCNPESFVGANLIGIHSFYMSLDTIMLTVRGDTALRDIPKFVTGAEV